MIHRDTIVALVILAGTTALYIASSKIMPQAAIFIRVVILAIGGLGLLLFVQSLIKKRIQNQLQIKDPEASKTSIVKKPVLIIAGAILVYMIVMQDLGFYVSGFLYFVAVVFLLDWKGLTLKAGVMNVVYAFIFMAVIYVLFNKVLVVQTPRGLLM